MLLLVKTEAVISATSFWVLPWTHKLTELWRRSFWLRLKLQRWMECRLDTLPLCKPLMMRGSTFRWVSSRLTYTNYTACQRGNVPSACSDFMQVNTVPLCQNWKEVSQATKYTWTSDAWQTLSPLNPSNSSFVILT